MPAASLTQRQANEPQPIDTKRDSEPVRAASPEPEKTAFEAQGETNCGPPEGISAAETAVQTEPEKDELKTAADGPHRGESLSFAHRQAVEVREPPATPESPTPFMDDIAERGGSVDDSEPAQQWTVERDAAMDEECGQGWESDPRLKGLLAFKKWWLLREVDISVNGKLLCGIPIFTWEGAMRVVNDRYSYIIPMHGVDYIRTPDGLQSIESEFEGSIHA